MTVSRLDYWSLYSLLKTLDSLEELNEKNVVSFIQTFTEYHSTLLFLTPQVDALVSELCVAISPMALGLTEAFGLTDAMISAPIALDWIGYNQYDNQGELE